MKLSDLTKLLIGKTSKRETIFFLFPNITSWNKSLLEFTLNGNISSSTLDNIINLSFSNKIGKNTPSNTLIENLLLFQDENGNDINKLNDIIFKEYQSQVNRIIVSNKDYQELFKEILDMLYQEQYLDIYYLQIIYTYLINKRYDITLFLISCMMILSPSIKNENNQKFDYFNDIIKFLKDFNNYEKYLKSDNITIQEYNLPKKNIDTLMCTNTFNENTHNFFINLLNDTSCKELCIMSMTAQSWIIHPKLRLKLIERLEKGLILKIIIMDKNTPFYNLYKNDNYSFETDYRILLKYPTTEIKYTDIPLTNRTFLDNTNNKMRVDFLIVPNNSSGSLSVFLEKDNPAIEKYYQKYYNQFWNIWNNYSYAK